MANVLLISAALTGLLILLMLGWDLLTRRRDIVSFRSIFLLGIFFFYGLATVFTIVLDITPNNFVPSDEGYVRLAALIPLFLAVFLVCARLGARLGWAGRLVPRLELPVTAPGLLISILVLETIALFTIFVPQSYLGVVMTMMRPGLIASATGLATYYLLARRLSPMAWAVFGCTLAFSALLATVGTVDRRFLLGVLGAAVWMWYWASLRYKRTTPVVARLSVAAAGLILLIGAYTGIRHAVGGTEGATLAVRAAQFTELARKGSIERGSFAMMFFQDTPNNTLFIIENYPEVYALRPLNGAGVVISNPVPRFFWPGKPEGLGIALQKQMGVEANLGTGIIGHGWAEGLYLGVIGYAVFFGLFVGAIDRVIRARAGNPYFLAAIGCSLGNILALPRGETSIFFLFAIVGFFATVMVLWLTRLVLGAFMQAGQPLWAFPVAADGGGAAGDGTDGLEPFDPDAPDDPYAGWDVPAETIQLDYAVAAAQNGMNGHGAPAPAAASSPAPKRG